MAEAVEEPPGSGRGVVRPWLVLTASCAALLIIAANTTSVNAAVNNLSNDLSLSASELTWVINAYLLGAAMVVASAGKLGDYIGVRAIFMIGLAAFAVGSVAVAIAEGPLLVTAGRAIQGVGSGFLMPATMSAIGLGIPPERRGFANGIWGAVAGIGFALGPLYGGAWTDLASWRGIFWSDLLMIAVAGALAWWGLGALPTPGGKGRIDVVGAVLFGVGMFAIVFAAQTVQQVGLESAVFIGAVVLALVLLLAFAEYESRREPAERLLDFRLIAKPAYWGANVGVFTSTGCLLAILYFSNLSAQSPVVCGLNAVEASLVLLPYGLALFVVSLIAGKLTDRFGFRVPVTIGMVITAIGLLLLAAVSLDDTLADLLVPLGLAGAGAGATFAATGAAAMSVAPADEAGEAAGTANTSRYMGAALGVAIASSLYATVALDTIKARLSDLGIGPADQETLENAITGTASALEEAVDTTPNADRAGVESAAEAAITNGFAAAMLFIAALAIVGAVVSAFTLRGRAKAT